MAKEKGRLIDCSSTAVSVYGTATVALVFSLLLTTTSAKKITEATEDNCEVCVKFMTKFINSLDDATKSNSGKVESQFRKTCKSTKGDDNRFCYYVGGLEESATGMLSEMSKPISWSMPADKVCMKLYRNDEQICDLRYEKSFDFANLNLKKLKVGELKQILADWGETCRGCSEKDDYIRLVEDVLPKYAPEAAAARKKSDL